MAILAIGACWIPVLTALAVTDPTSTIAPSAVVAITPPTVSLHLRITAYTSDPDETDDTPFITADGAYCEDGVVATNLLPFGTKIQIPSLFGNKIFTVEDRMNPRYPTSVDIWMPSKTKALFFGVHMADIIILPQSIKLANN